MNIDLDEGRIQVESEWLSVDEIKYAIKTKISSDDYDVADLSSAMKKLKKAIDESVAIEFRITTDIEKQLNALAKERGETVGSILRALIHDNMGDLPAVTEKEDEPEEEKEEEKEDEPEPEDEPEEDEPEEEKEDEPEEEKEEEDSEDDEESDQRVRRSSRRRSRRR